MKIVFFGSPDFAVPSLNALIQSNHEVLSIITQPDKRRGRSNRLIPTPVKSVALKHEIEISQPHSIRDSHFYNYLKSKGADIIVVVAYGKILPRQIIEMPIKDCLNVHASLLPKYRGAAPINWAIINDEKETGITTMQMDEGLDTGPVYLRKNIGISYTDTCESLSMKLSKLGAEVLLETLDRIEKDGIHPVPQTGTPTYARPLQKNDAQIDWSKSSIEIYNLIRGLYPKPSAFTFINGERIKIINVIPAEIRGEAAKVIKQNKHELLIGTSDNCLSILELQPEGKKPMTISAFLSGRKEKLYVG